MGKNTIIAILLVIIVGLLYQAGYDDKGSRVNSIHENSTKNTLANLFAIDLIGTQISFLENKIGPAKWAGDKVKTYELSDGCSLTIYRGDNDSIVAATAFITEEGCNIDVNKLTLGDPRGFFSAKELTVENFEKEFGKLLYYSDCMGQWCGNAFDPVDYAVYRGNKHNGYIDIAIGTYYSGDYEIYSKWVNLMIEKEGDDWVISRGYNCDPYKYQSIAGEVLKDRVASRVYMGRNLMHNLEVTDQCPETR